MTTRAVAAERVSRYTSIANGDCRFDPVGKEAGAEESQTKRCRGLAGTRLVVQAGGTTTSLAFEWPGRPGRPRSEGVVGWSLGETLEWRGRTAGAFTPDAVIVRVLFHESESNRRHQVLGVLHVAPGRACLLGAVDMTADATPYDTARRLADTRGPSFVCGREAPAVGGPATAWTRSTLDRTLREAD